jgi:hypothetical protein
MVLELLCVPRWRRLWSYLSNARWRRAGVVCVLLVQRSG